MKLKPCPFCGGEAQIVPHSFYNTEKGDYEVSAYGIICEECASYGCQFNETEEEAIEAWNRREPIDKIVEQLEEYKNLECDDPNEDIDEEVEDAEEQGRLIEQKYGTWRPVAFDSVCSSCRYSETTPLMIMRRDFRYCPSCGAKMVSEAKLKELEG